MTLSRTLTTSTLALHAALAVPFVATAALLMPSEAVAQQAQSYNIPSQPLQSTLLRIASQNGLALTYEGRLASGRTAPSITGTMSAAEAVRRALAGSDLQGEVAGSSITIIRRPEPTAAVAVGSPGGAIVLDPIVLQGAGSGTGPVGGIIARTSGAATKTDADVLTTPQASSTISREQMEMQGVQTVDQALKYSPGVTTESSGINNAQDILTVRSFEGRSQALDGVILPVGTLTGMRIEPYGLERIDLVRGAASSLYGVMPPGGLVALTSKRPTDAPYHEVKLGFGNRNQRLGAVDISDKLAPNLRYRVVGLARSDDSQVDYEHRKRDFLSGALTWDATDQTSVTFLAQYQNDSQKQPFQTLPLVGTLAPNPGHGSIDPRRYHGEPNWDKFTHQHVSFGYDLKHEFDNGWTLSQTLQYRKQKVFQRGVSASPLDPGKTVSVDRWLAEEDQHDNSLGLDTRLSGEFKLGASQHKMLAGVDFSRINTQYDWWTDRGRTGLTLDYYNPVYRPFINPGKLDLGRSEKTSQRQTGIYVQDEISIDRWTILASGRYDRVNSTVIDQKNNGRQDRQDSAFSWRLGTSYRAENNITPWVSLSNSFEPLTGADYENNLYRPKKARQAEVGVKWENAAGDAMLQASVFRIDQRNILTPHPQAGSGGIPTWASAQLGKARVEGFELEGRAELADGLSVIGSYTYLDSKIIEGTAKDANVGNQLPNSPHNQAALWVDYKVPENSRLAGLSFGAGARYKGASYGSVGNEYRTGSATLFDAAIRYDFTAQGYEGLQAEIVGTNIADKVYLASCQSDFACSFGSRRSVLATVSYKW